MLSISNIEVYGPAASFDEMGETSASGSYQPHNNMQPYYVADFYMNIEEDTGEI